MDGVPVVSRCGDWPAPARASIPHSSLGLGHWAADSEAEFVAAALALASDVPAPDSHRAARPHAGLALAGWPAGGPANRTTLAPPIWPAMPRRPLTATSNKAVREHARRELATWLDKKPTPGCRCPACRRETPGAVGGGDFV